MQLPVISNYYRITYSSDGSGGQFNFQINICRADAFSGDGSELGNGSASGIDQLTSLAQAIATGIEAQSAPFWDNISIVSIETNPTDPVQIYP